MIENGRFTASRFLSFSSKQQYEARILIEDAKLAQRLNVSAPGWETEPGQDPSWVVNSLRPTRAVRPFRLRDRSGISGWLERD